MTASAKRDIDVGEVGADILNQAEEAVRVAAHFTEVVAGDGENGDAFFPGLGERVAHVARLNVAEPGTHIQAAIDVAPHRAGLLVIVKIGVVMPPDARGPAPISEPAAGNVLLRLLDVVSSQA